MNNRTLHGLYNCTATILKHNITFLLKLNSSELLKILEDSLDTSSNWDVLVKAIVECVSVHRGRPFDLPWWQKLIWSLLFAAMLLIATGGNAIVMWIVLAHQRMRTVTNYFLVNLSVADLMMSLLNCAFNFTFMLNSNWPFGVVYCTINNFVTHLTVASSVFTLAVISIDRYMAIMKPLKHRISRKMTVITMIFIWTIASALALPCLLYSTTKSRRYLDGKTRTICYLSWPDGDYLESRIEYSYNIVFLSVTYLIPITLMAVCYALMGRKLWITKSIGELTHYQKNLMKSKRKVVKMFITVVAIFAICWLPYQGFFIYVYHHRHFAENSNVQHVYLAFYWLAMSNAMVNPIIYYWMNTTFRIYFQLIICKCCCSINQTNVESHRKQQSVKCQQSDVVHFSSKHLRLNSVRWKHSTVDSQVQNCRMISIGEKNRSSQDATIV